MAQRAIEPYVFFGGRCEEAIEFYKKAIGAEVEMLMRFRESPEPMDGVPPGFGDKVMHASLKVGGSRVMASDGCGEEQGGYKGFSLSISVENDAEAERVFSALSEGGQVQMPLTQTFWTSKFGMLTDRFGMGWMVSVMHK